MILIGISGRAGHGKDTLAKFIMEHVSKEFSIKRYAFADELKEDFFDRLSNETDELWKLTPRPGVKYSDIIYADNKLDFVNSRKDLFRSGLQILGEYMRSKNKFYWIRKLDAKIKPDDLSVKVGLITDLRYQNELFYIKSKGGYAIRVNRTGYVNKNIDSNHPSETELLSAKFDITIDCMDGDIDSLRNDAIESFEAIRRDVSSDFINSQVFSEIGASNATG